MRASAAQQSRLALFADSEPLIRSSRLTAAPAPARTHPAKLSWWVAEESVPEPSAAAERERPPV